MPVAGNPAFSVYKLPTKEGAKRMESIPPVRSAESGRRYRRIACLVFQMALPVCLAARAPHQDQATLYFFNSSGWKAIPEKLTVLDNSEKIAQLNRQQFVVLSLAPGHHVLQPKEEHPPKENPKHEADQDAKPGVAYYVAGALRRTYRISCGHSRKFPKMTPTNYLPR
jgi:hypothetical protein